MYGRLYEVGNSLRLLFNCGCSMVQITFRWKIVRRRISQTQNQIFTVLNGKFLPENYYHVKFWCERKTNNSPPHLRLWISWRGTPPILRLISDYAAEAHLQEPEQCRFQFGIFLFSSLVVLLYESSFNKVDLSQRRSYGITPYWAWTWKLKVVSESALLWFFRFCGEMVLDLFYIFYSNFFLPKDVQRGEAIRTMPKWMPFTPYAIVPRWLQTALNVRYLNRVKAANIETPSRLAVFPTMYLYLQIFLVMIGYLCHFVLAFLAETWDGGCWTLIAGSRTSSGERF